MPQNSLRSHAEEGGEAVSSSVELGGSTFEFETNELARLANGSCTVACEETLVLATAVLEGSDSPVRREHHFSLPLQVNYRERASALGKTLHGNKRRETVTERENWAAAIIDRVLRPHFPRGLFRALQVSIDVLSMGNANPVALAINAASTALMCSNIPWGGPVGAVHLAHTGGNILVTPSTKDGAKAEMSLLIATTQDEVVMAEFQGREMPEAAVLQLFEKAQSEAKGLLEPQRVLAKRLNTIKDRFPLSGADQAAYDRVLELGRGVVDSILQDPTHNISQKVQQLAEAKCKLQKDLRTSGFFRLDAVRIPGSGCVSQMDLDHAWHDIVKAVARNQILVAARRMDGRGLRDARLPRSAYSFLPSAHGSSLCNQGQTQALSTVTIGSPRPQRDSDASSSLEPFPRQFGVQYTSHAAEWNRALHRSQRALIRHEQHIGFTIERALENLLPPGDSFPFAIRLTAEVLAADGSLLETAINSSVLALRAANIRPSRLAAAVSVGMVSNIHQPCLAGITQRHHACEPHRFNSSPHHWELITDAQGLEEAAEDMHLTVTGTSSGVLSIQLHCSGPGIPMELLGKALTQARQGRLDVLGALEASTQGHLGGCQYGSFDIAKEHIGRLVGSAGTVIRGIEDDSGARIVIQNDGKVHLFAPSPTQFQRAEGSIGAITGIAIKEGEVYSVKVVKLLDYGAFVELPNGYQTLLHISEVSHARVRSVEDILKVGMQIEVLCLGRNERGFVKVSRRALEGGKGALPI